MSGSALEGLDFESYDGPVIDMRILDLFARTRKHQAAVDVKQRRRLAHTKRSAHLTAKDLRAARMAYEAGNIVALQDAMAFCIGHGKWAKWVINAVQAELGRTFTSQRPTRRGRNARPATRFKNDMKDYYRWAWVMMAIDSVGWKPRAYKIAARMLRGTAAKGSWSTMKAARDRVSKRMKADPHRYYLPRYIRPDLS